MHEPPHSPIKAEYASSRRFHQRFTGLGLDDAFAMIVYKHKSDHAAETSI